MNIGMDVEGLGKPILVHENNNTLEKDQDQSPIVNQDDGCKTIATKKVAGDLKKCKNYF